ncbi:MAG TPA: HEAT repeat domain-containing protein [Kofleriaceae bacterium]|nr:HEAT repeat domain-containing protein [Kofleriaceae bacterium]
MKNLSKLAAVAIAVMAASPAYAGKGGSAALINSAVQSGSVGAIRAEVERTEGLNCEECVQTLTNLTADPRYEVREVAAWWFAKRPALLQVMVGAMEDDLGSSDSVHVRNAADFLGRVRQYQALPGLAAAMGRGLSSDAKLAIVRAVAFMAHVKGNPILQTAMGDADPAVRAAAVDAWRNVLGQTSVVPVEPLLRDSDAHVRAEAAMVVGAYADQAARPVLEQIVTSDVDASTRRNAAWALGQIGSKQSAPALAIASTDASGLVRQVAKAALGQLK